MMKLISLVFSSLGSFRYYIATSALVGFLYFSVNALYQHIYFSGFNDATAEFKEQLDKQLKGQRQDDERRFNEAFKAQSKLHELDVDRIKSERVVSIKTVEVIKYVDRIKVVDECVDLASNTVRMLSKATDIVAGRKESGSSKTKDQ